MKKLAVLFLTLSLSAALVGCGSEKKETEKQTEAATTEAATTEAATTEEATEEATTEAATTEEATEEATTEAATTEEATEEATTEAATTEEATEAATTEAATTEEATEEATTEAATTEEATEEATTEAAATEEVVEVMTHEEYMAAEMDTQVVVETYVQAKQSWWDGAVTVYAQSEDGAYFIYNMACTEEEDKELEIGTKIKVTGYKAEWSGEVEIIDATFEILEGEYVAEATDVTELLANEEELIAHQNELVAFKGMTVEASKDADGNDVAYLYKWDGSGQEGDDLYFNVSLNGETYSFTVESYLCGMDTDVYKAVQALEIGDVIDMEGFLYWYEGVNPHIIAVTAAE